MVRLNSRPIHLFFICHFLSFLNCISGSNCPIIDDKSDQLVFSSNVKIYDCVVLFVLFNLISSDVYCSKCPVLLSVTGLFLQCKIFCSVLVSYLGKNQIQWLIINDVFMLKGLCWKTAGIVSVFCSFSLQINNQCVQITSRSSRLLKFVSAVATGGAKHTKTTNLQDQWKQTGLISWSDS